MFYSTILTVRPLVATS